MAGPTFVGVVNNTSVTSHRSRACVAREDLDQGMQIFSLDLWQRSDHSRIYNYSFLKFYVMSHSQA